MRNSLRAVFFVFAATFLPATIAIAQNAAPRPPAENAFTDRNASVLLAQFAEALQGHSQKKLLAIFDLSRMKDSALFQQQIISFFAQTESIRIHLTLAGTSVEGEKATVAVDAEMDVEPRNGPPPARRNERLNFVAVNAGGSWKFVDIQPRSFFSLP